MKGFQEHGKDIDREILFKIKEDKEFLKVCNLNNYFRNEVCNDNFFRTRLSITYPNTLKYKAEKISWKSLKHTHFSPFRATNGRPGSDKTMTPLDPLERI